MNEEEKVVSRNKLEQDGEVVLFEGKPFSGVRIDSYENGQKSGDNTKMAKKRVFILVGMKTDRKRVKNITKMEKVMVLRRFGMKAERKILRNITKTEKKKDFGWNGQKKERKHMKGISKREMNYSFSGRPLSKNTTVNNIQERG